MLPRAIHGDLPHQPHRFDRHTPWTPAGHTIKQETHEDLRKRQSAICCAQCQHRITDHAARLESAGGHLHVFTNPGGFTFEIALYEYADCVAHGPATTEYTWFPGFTFEIALYEYADCVSHGPATTEYTWFPGYAWQLALCGNCHEHLGWRYRQAGSAGFYGLIRDRLVEINI